MNKSVFVNSRRPGYVYGSGSVGHSFAVLTHFPNQRLRYSQLKDNWEVTEPDVSYGMRFYVFGLEVMQLRRKATRLCNLNWRNDDESVKLMMVKNINCTPPYWKKFNNIRLECTNMQELKAFYEMIGMDDVLVPCRTISRLGYSYSEYSSRYYQIAKRVPNSSKTFFISFKFPVPTFKEISLIKEMGEVPLFGTAGGYIGICVGYSFLQLPTLLLMICHKARMWICGQCRPRIEEIQ